YRFLERWRRTAERIGRVCFGLGALGGLAWFLDRPIGPNKFRRPLAGIPGSIRSGLGPAAARTVPPPRGGRRLGREAFVVRFASRPENQGRSTPRDGRSAGVAHEAVYAGMTLRSRRRDGPCRRPGRRPFAAFATASSARP